MFSFLELLGLIDLSGPFFVEMQVPEPAQQQRAGRQLAVPGGPGALHAAPAADHRGQRQRARLSEPGQLRALLPGLLPHVTAHAAARGVPEHLVD